MKATLLNYVESRVSQFRHTTGLSDTEAINIKSLLLKLNVLTIFKPLSKTFSGMSLTGNGKYFMLVNSQQPLCRQHFTIAHELYHLFIEDRPVPYSVQMAGVKSESEQCADAFALRFLMPGAGVRQMVPEDELKSGKLTLGTILRMSQYFGTSYSAVLNRLVDIGLLTRTEREGLSTIPVRRTSREYGYDISLYEPGNEGLVIGDFGEKARHLFESDMISEGHYHELLHKIGITKLGIITPDYEEYED